MIQAPLRRALAAALIAAVVIAMPVTASPPADETLVLMQNADTFNGLGFTATGPITCTGDWVVTRLVLGSSHTLLFGDVESTQTCLGIGAFELSFHGGTTPVGSVAAPWRLSRGTGAFNGFTGNGSWTQAYIPGTPNVLVFTLTGRVHS